MNFQSPKEILKVIQQIPVIVHELTYKSQQTVSDIDLETTPGFHKLQEEARFVRAFQPPAPT
jgi:hypothetical protein